MNVFRFIDYDDWHGPGKFCAYVNLGHLGLLYHEGKKSVSVMVFDNLKNEYNLDDEEIEPYIMQPWLAHIMLDKVFVELEGIL